MGRSQRKWEEIYHQMNSEKNLIEQNDESRFLLFISFGEAKNLPLIPSSSSGHPIECWIRIRLCDADGTPLHDEEAIDSKYIPYSENPNFGMIPMMIGDSHHINASLDTLEDTVMVFSKMKYDFLIIFFIDFSVSSLHHYLKILLLVPSFFVLSLFMEEETMKMIQWRIPL